MTQQLHTGALRALLASRLPALKGLSSEERERLVEAAADLADFAKDFALNGRQRRRSPSHGSFRL